MFDLSGKKALVTGASGGIGAEIAKALHGAGAAVGLSGTRTEPLEALAAELGELAHVLPCNLSDKDAVEAIGGGDGLKVNTLNRKGKTTRVRGTNRRGSKPNTKRAIVTLKAGEKIDLV